MSTECQPPLTTPQIIQGEDKTLTLRLTSQITKLPFDISGASEIIAAFLKGDGTTLEKKFTNAGEIIILSGPGGTFQVVLTVSDTALLAIGTPDGYQGMQIKITISGKVTIIMLPNSIQVYAPLFPIP